MTLAIAIIYTYSLQMFFIIFQLFYSNYVTDAPKLLKMKSCGESCTLDEFIQVLHPVLPNNWEEECKSK